MPMGLFDGIAIVSDIDGTFLGLNSRIVPENLEKISYFQREGGGFTVATGREHFLIYTSIPQIEDFCNWPVIACNGSYIIDLRTKKKLAEAFLDDEALIPVIRETQVLCPNCGFRITMGDENFYIERYYDYIGWLNEWCPERARVMPLEKMPRGRWYKAVFDGPAEEIDRAFHRLSRLDSRFVPVRACETIVEIQPGHGTKGAMLKKARALMNAKTVYAIGDYENDYDMLISADCCAVPENGIDKLKRIPGIIPVCHHDRGAIADLIDHIEKELRR